MEETQPQEESQQQPQPAEHTQEGEQAKETEPASQPGDTEAGDIEEGFSSTSKTIGSASSDSSGLEGHHGQAGVAA